MTDSFVKISEVKEHFALMRQEMQSVNGGAFQQINKKYGVVSEYGIVDYYGIVEYYGVVQLD